MNVWDRFTAYLEAKAWAGELGRAWLPVARVVIVVLKWQIARRDHRLFARALRQIDGLGLELNDSLRVAEGIVKYGLSEADAVRWAKRRAA